MSNFTQSLSSVLNVMHPLAGNLTWLDIKEFTEEKGLIFVIYVEEDFQYNQVY
jgi:hypothetical protein